MLNNELYREEVRVAPVVNSEGTSVRYLRTRVAAGYMIQAANTRPRLVTQGRTEQVLAVTANRLISLLLSLQANAGTREHASAYGRAT